MQLRRKERPRTKSSLLLIGAFAVTIIKCVIYVVFSEDDVPVSAIFKRRHLCQTSKPMRSFSTSRDLLYTCVLKKNHWYDVTLLSVRTSGCKAKIALVTETDHDFGRFFGLILRYTDTDVYRVDPPTKGSRDYIRNTMALEFLRAREDQFDRVIMMDAFDVYFQSDPFEFLNFPNSIALGSEGVKIKDDWWDTEWVKGCYGKEGLKEIGDKVINCYGVIYGPMKLFLKFLSIIMEPKNWEHCGIDQAVMNYLYHTGYFASQGVDVKVFDCNGPILTLNLCPKDIKVFNGVRETVNGKGVVPAIVHQWNKNRTYKHLYYERCNIPKFLSMTEKEVFP